MPSGLACGPGVEGLLPLVLGLLAAVQQLAGVGDDLVGHLEGLLRVEAQHLLGGGDLVGAQRRAVRLAGALQLGGRPGDDRPQLDEARLVGDRLAPPRWRRSRAATFSSYCVSPLVQSTVCTCQPYARVAGGDVLGQGDVGVVLDGDPVAVVDQRQVAQPLGAGQRGRLGADALLDVAVGGQAVDLVVEERLARGGVGIEQAALAAGGHRHARPRSRCPGRADRW